MISRNASKARNNSDEGDYQWRDQDEDSFELFEGSDDDEDWVYEITTHL